MADRVAPPPQTVHPPTARAEADRAARQAREAAALRENLRKRRQQNQQRSASAPSPDTIKQAD